MPRTSQISAPLLGYSPQSVSKTSLVQPNQTIGAQPFRPIRSSKQSTSPSKPQSSQQCTLTSEPQSSNLPTSPSTRLYAARELEARNASNQLDNLNDQSKSAQKWMPSSDPLKIITSSELAQLLRQQSKPTSSLFLHHNTSSNALHLSSYRSVHKLRVQRSNHYRIHVWSNSSRICHLHMAKVVHPHLVNSSDLKLLTPFWTLTHQSRLIPQLKPHQH